MTFPVIAQQALLLSALSDADRTVAENVHTLPVMNFSLQPIRASFITREPNRSFLGTLPQIASFPYAEISFDLMLPVTDEDASPCQDLLISCGFKTETDSDHPLYKYWVTADEPTSSMNFYYYSGGEHFEVSQAFGNCVLLMEAGQIPLLRFRFIGEHAKISAGEPPLAKTSQQWGHYLPTSPQNTSFRMGELARLSIRRFSVNLQNSIRLVKRINNSQIIIENRKPTGSILFDFTPHKTFNPFDQALEDETISIDITHGDTNSRHWRFVAPYVQFLETAIERDEALSVFRSNLAFHQINSSSPQLPEMRFYLP